MCCIIIVIIENNNDKIIYKYVNVLAISGTNPYPFQTRSYKAMAVPLFLYGCKNLTHEITRKKTFESGINVIEVYWSVYIYIYIYIYITIKIKNEKINIY